jgi:hypothetical protein
MKRYFAITIALVGFGAIASADVFTQLTDRVSQSTSPTFDEIDWGDNYAGGSVASGSGWTSFDGATGTVVNTSGATMYQLTQGASWNGNFDGGEQLLWNGNYETNPVDGTQLFFNTPVNSVAFGLEANFHGTFTGQLELLNQFDSVIAILILGGTSSAAGDGSELFMGLQDDSGANIYGIDIQTYASFDTNDFAIDAVSMTSDSNTNVPEPGSIVLLASVVLGVAGLLRRRLSGESA